MSLTESVESRIDKTISNQQKTLNTKKYLSVYRVKFFIVVQFVLNKLIILGFKIYYN